MSLICQLTFEVIKHHFITRGKKEREKKKKTLSRNCVKVEVAVLGSPFPIVLMVSVDVKQH